MLSITPELLLSWHPCWEEDRVRAAFGDAPSLTPLQIWDRADVSAEDRLWVLLRPEIIPERELVLLACGFAEKVLPIYETAYPNDTRPRVAIETRRRHLAGLATDAELDAARAAARDAAWDAARAAAWDAAWDAARDAAWDAARDTAWAAAWDAARDTAWAAAWDAELLDVRAVLVRLESP